MNLLAASGFAPDSAIDVMLMPSLLLFFGVVIWAVGLGRLKMAETAPWRWIALPLMLIGAYLGLLNVMQYMDPVYRMATPGNRMLVAHWGSFLLPLAGALAFVLTEVLKRSPNKGYGQKR